MRARQGSTRLESRDQMLARRDQVDVMGWIGGLGGQRRL